MRFASVSVDLDEIPNYFQIHGLDVPAGTASLVYDVALPRLLSMAQSAGIPMTFFAIGQDLHRPESAQRLRHAVTCRAGHEVANHTLEHRYNLVRLGRAEITRQIAEGAAAIEEATGQIPVGFRAPGYTISDEVFDVLDELGVAYDASVFPCPWYFAAKTAAITAIAARGRTSRSLVDTPRVLRAPRQPYRAGRPYWKRGNGLVTIPVQVTRGLRLPFIGTSVALAGPARARVLARMCAGEPLVNLELHGIDVLDVNDGLEALRPYQVDVRIERERKQNAILAAIDELRKAGYAFVTMRDMAACVF